MHRCHVWGCTDAMYGDAWGCTDAKYGDAWGCTDAMYGDAWGCIDAMYGDGGDAQMRCMGMEGMHRCDVWGCVGCTDAIHGREVVTCPYSPCR